jgi:hypothetical protein
MLVSANITLKQPSKQAQPQLNNPYYGYFMLIIVVLCSFSLNFKLKLQIESLLVRQGMSNWLKSMRVAHPRL